MFDNNIQVEPIPERVFELCTLVSKKEETEVNLKEMFEPKALNSSNTTYFGYIRDVGIELGLIKKENDMLEYIGDMDAIKNLVNFRKYCNSRVWKNEDTYFYKIARCFLDSNESWLKYSTVTDMHITSEVREKTGITNIQNVYMLGMRFWISFLGFGLIQESGGTINYLPNMYTALKDFISLTKPEIGKEYTISEFLGIISNVSTVALGDAFSSHSLNLALSNGLRQLHDKKAIVLKNNSDSKDVWTISLNNAHPISSHITHIIVKEINL